VCCSALQCVSVAGEAMEGRHFDSVCCSVLGCIAVCCSVLQCVAVCIVMGETMESQILKRWLAKSFTV